MDFVFDLVHFAKPSLYDSYDAVTKGIFYSTINMYIVHIRNNLKRHLLTA